MSDTEESQLLEARCFSCKEQVAIKEPEFCRTPNDRLRIRGECSVCGKKVSRFVADPQRPALTLEQRKEREERRRIEKKNSIVKSVTKVDKKAGKKKSLKECKNCACVTHQQLVEQPKKKKRISKKEREIQELKKQLEELKGAESSGSDQDMPEISDE